EGGAYPYADEPIGHESSILTRRHAAPRLWTCEKEFAKPLARDLEIIVNCLARMFGQLKSNWSPGLSLAHRRSGNCITIGSNIIDSDRDYVAASQLTVDGKIEH